MSLRDEIERGREAFARRAWGEAHAQLARAARAAQLEGGDLELLATSAYMLGRDEEWTRGLERAHHAHLEAGARGAAPRRRRSHEP